MNNTSEWRDGIESALALLTTPDLAGPAITALKDKSYGWDNCPCGEVTRLANGCPRHGGLEKLSVIFTNYVVDAWAWFQLGTYPAVERELNSAVGILRQIDYVNSKLESGEWK